MSESKKATNNQVAIALVGNPGVGKSTLLNGLVGHSVFKSGISFGTGLTAVLQAHKEGNVTFYDTPGLNDVEKRKAAGKELDKLLENNIQLKIIFVVTVMQGRVSPQDATTISLVLDAITSCDTNDRFAVVLNQVSKAFLDHVTNDPFTETKIRSQITGNRHTSHWCYVPADPEFHDKSNGILYAPQLAQLLATMSETRPINATVANIDTDSYEEKLSREVRAFEEKENLLREEIENHKVQIQLAEKNMQNMKRTFEQERRSITRQQKVAERAMKSLEDKVLSQQSEVRMANEMANEMASDLRSELARVQRDAKHRKDEARHAVEEMREELRRVNEELSTQRRLVATTEPSTSTALVGPTSRGFAPSRFAMRVSARVQDRISIGDSLNAGENLLSKTGRFKLCHRKNGDVVIYDHFKPKGSQTVWSAGTSGRDSSKLVLARDGFFKLLDSDGDEIWRADSKRNRANHAVMQNDGNFVLYSDTGPVWSSNSWQHGWSHNDRMF